jgi:hypothetical protein
MVRASARQAIITGFFNHFPLFGLYALQIAVVNALREDPRKKGKEKCQPQ